MAKKKTEFDELEAAKEEALAAALEAGESIPPAETPAVESKSLHPLQESFEVGGKNYRLRFGRFSFRMDKRRVTLTAMEAIQDAATLEYIVKNHPGLVVEV